MNYATPKTEECNGDELFECVFHLEFGVGETGRSAFGDRSIFQSLLESLEMQIEKSLRNGIRDRADEKTLQHVERKMVGTRRLELLTSTVSR